MRETIEIGSTPYGEECAQVGTDEYIERGRLECQVFAKQLLRAYRAAHRDTILPYGCALKLKSNAHDFGNYYEVVVNFDSSDKDATEAAYWFEANSPEFWDDTAKAELKLPI